MLHLQGVPESPFSPFSPYKILHFRANALPNSVSVIITTAVLKVLYQTNVLTQRKVTFLGLTLRSVPAPFKLMLMGIPGVAVHTFCET